MEDQTHNEKGDQAFMKLETAAHEDPRDAPEWQRIEKKLVRKLDMTLLPMVWVLYMFNYLDRNNIA
jgi:hypothetical protein